MLFADSGHVISSNFGNCYNPTTGPYSHSVIVADDEYVIQEGIAIF